MLYNIFSVVQVVALVASAVLLAVIMLIRKKTLPSERAQKTKNYRRGFILSAVILVTVSITNLYIQRNPRPIDMGNPFFTGWETPFGVPPFDRIRPEHFEPAFEAAMQEELAQIDSIVNDTSEPGFENVIAALDRSGGRLDEVSRIFSLLSSADTNDELDAVKTRISPVLSAHADAVSMNAGLFDRIRAVYDRRSELALNEAQARLLERTYTRFVRSGALLDDDRKEELRGINEELTLLSVRFGNNRREAVNAFQLKLPNREQLGLPSNAAAAARNRAEAAGIQDTMLFTLQKPVWLQFMTYANDAELRRQMFEAYNSLCAEGTPHDNTGIINRIVELRLKKAGLLGFDTYANFVLDERMAKTPANVYALLDDIWEPALEKAKLELADLHDKKRNMSQNPEVGFDPWDWWYYAEKVRKERYDVDEEQLKNYFSIDNVRVGIFTLTNRLYGITFRPLTAPVYNKDCLVYEVFDKDNTHLGVLYLDYYLRAGKKPGAWCGSYRVQGVDENGQRISPVVTIVCNFAEPVGSTPALLTLDEVETFFHEFGHALHSLFADVPFRGLHGVERDFVELPSQIMENWATEPQILKSYAIHYRTSDPIPDRWITNIQRSKHFNQGFNTVELLAASYADMDIHMMKEYKPFNVAEFERFALNEKRGLIPEIETRYHYPYFSHIFDGGYAAGYYGYIWAEVLDKDAYEAFVESGDIVNNKIAGRFRERVLAPRGLRDGMRLYVDFRGREPLREPLFYARGLREAPQSAVESKQPPQAVSDSLLRVILGEGPLEE